MAWYDWAIYSAATFFAATWALGLILSPRNRTGGNICTVIIWWAVLVASWLAPFSSLHLLWAFPVALLVPPLLLLPLGRL